MSRNTRSSLQTPSRRQTLAMIPSGEKSRSKVSKDVGLLKTASAADANDSTTTTTSNGIPPTSRTNSRASRKSMLPRVGRENSDNKMNSNNPPTVSKPTESSRRRSVAQNNGNSAATSDDRRKSTYGDRRQTMGGNDRRRSVLPGSLMNHQSKPDPRPIHEKKFQQASVYKILDFLEVKGYPYPVSAKSLLRPSSKDFYNVVTFLLRLVDTAFQKGEMKIEDEIFLSFQRMGYPFVISKTNIVAAGSSHAWPTLLAALAWLVKQLQHVEKEERSDELNTVEPFESIDELDMRSDTAFYQYSLEAYQAFLNSDQQNQNELEEVLAKRFDTDDYQLQAEFDRVSDLNGAIIERMEVLKDEAEPLALFEQKRDALATDLEQFYDLIRQNNFLKSDLQDVVAARTRELEKAKNDLEKTENQLQKLANTVETQDISMNEFLKMKSESKGIMEAMDRLKGVKEERLKAFRESEEALFQHINSCKESVDIFNSKLADLADYPDLLARYNSIKVSFNEDGLLSSAQEDILGQDVKSITTALSDCSHSIADKSIAVKLEYQDALDRFSKCLENKNVASSSQRIVEDKILKSEEILKQERKAYEGKLEVRQGEVSVVEQKLASLNDPVELETQMATYERQLAALESLLSEHKAESVSKKQVVLFKLTQAFQIMAHHEEIFKRKLEEVERHRDILKLQAPKLFVPENILSSAIVVRENDLTAPSLSSDHQTNGVGEE